jgi:transposase
MLEREKQHYQETGTFLNRYALNKRFAGRGGTSVPATTVQCLSDRLTKALANFLKYKDDGWGFPRFRSGNQWHSIQLRQFAKGKDIWLDGCVLRVPGKLGTAIKIKRHRAMKGTPKTGYLVKRADGHGYALIVCALPVTGDVAHPADERSAVGIDVGLKVFLADSNGGVVENPRYTTQQCANCGEYVQKSLSVRTHICPHCGYVADRDVNAAQNILQAGAPPSGMLADGLADEPRSRLL